MVEGIWRVTTFAIVLIFVCVARPFTGAADAPDRPYTQAATDIVREALCFPSAYAMLQDLTAVGPRLSGTPQAETAVQWARRTMVDLGFDNVHLEPVQVPVWVRGPVERAYALSGRKIPLKVCALGSSAATPRGGITAEVIEVHSLDEVRRLGDVAKGKIIFYNRPMNPSLVTGFAAYGDAVDQRGRGPTVAAQAGAVAALVRSMSLTVDDHPHTGNTSFADGVAPIPAAALSTLAADTLERLIATHRGLRVSLELSCRTLPDAMSANVVGEIRGAEKPDEVVVVGGHLDSWDKGVGAHDDGSGCVEAIEALRILRTLDLRPKRTIRAVLFMNEENGLRGGREYAAAERSEKHIAAIESDAGGFAPRGFGVSGSPETVARVAAWAYLLTPIGADRIVPGGGGADISPLAAAGVPAIGLSPESSRYFDYHHCETDTIDKVNPRELELGATAMAILSYALAQEGL